MSKPQSAAPVVGDGKAGVMPDPNRPQHEIEDQGDEVRGHRQSAPDLAFKAPEIPIKGELPRDRELVPGPQLDKEIRITALAIAFTVIASCFAVFELVQIFLELTGQARWGTLLLHTLFMVIASFLIYGGLIYQVTRYIYLKRRESHRPVSRSDLDSPPRGHWPSLTVLVPSYMEEVDVVRMTLLSAALQDYPNKRVVLLIDDPPESTSDSSFLRLDKTRELVNEIQAAIGAQHQRIEAVRAESAEKRRGPNHHSAEDMRSISRLCFELAEWFVAQARAIGRDDPAAQVLADGVLLPQAECLVSRAQEFEFLIKSGIAFHQREIELEFDKLLTLFDAKLTAFERKRYENLSHRSNKAMNLNAYIGLMGGSYRDVHVDGKLRLEKSAESAAGLVVPRSDYIITLDADSIIAPEYARRLIRHAEQPDNERVAIVQTPYSAFPRSETAVERIAGATTDIQYIIHQGFMGADAAYWVGANAVLRMSAIEEIVVTESERNFPVKIFIQDRTVIEDTESTVDLIDRGWKLFNYPERLAYSATPPDFGSLLIQRRRWSNGGLLILPKLLRYLFRSGSARPRGQAGRLKEGLMRFHYLASITAVNFGLVIIMAVPFTESIRSAWLPLAAVPYFYLYLRDLVLAGYRKSDLLRVYSLNLVLIPVNLGGVLKSIEQAWTKKKIPFVRTPKIRGRTTTAAIYILAEYALLLSWFGQALIDVHLGFWFHAAFAAGNAMMLYYGIKHFIGIRASIQDLGASWKLSLGPRIRSAAIAANVSTDD